MLLLAPSLLHLLSTCSWNRGAYSVVALAPHCLPGVSPFTPRASAVTAAQVYPNWHCSGPAFLAANWSPCKSLLSTSNETGIKIEFIYKHILQSALCIHGCRIQPQIESIQGKKKSQKVPNSKTWICRALSTMLNPREWSDV